MLQTVLHRLAQPIGKPDADGKEAAQKQTDDAAGAGQGHAVDLKGHADHGQHQIGSQDPEHL